MKIRCYCYQSGSVPVQGALITLYDRQGAREKKLTNVNGMCVFRHLPCGEYAVRQTSAPFYLIKSNATHYCTLDNDCRCDEVGFFNLLRYAAADIPPSVTPQTRGIINQKRADAANLPPPALNPPPEE